MLPIEAKIDIERYLEPLIDLTIGKESEIVRSDKTGEDRIRIKKGKRKELIQSINEQMGQYAKEYDVDISEVREYVMEVLENTKVLHDKRLHDIRKKILLASEREDIR